MNINIKVSQYNINLHFSYDLSYFKKLHKKKARMQNAEILRVVISDLWDYE